MSPDSPLIFLPLLAHLLLVFALFIKLGIEKSKAVDARQVDRAAAALDKRAWPDAVMKVSNNIDNQFQVPMLFYALTFVAYLTQHTSALMIGLLGLFVVSRYVHAYIHITSNYVPHRFRAFLAGILLLLALTVWQVIRLFL